MASTDRRMARQQAQHLRPLMLRVLGLLAHPARQQRLELRLGLDVTAKREAAELVDVLPLALARRVVHERDHAQRRLCHQRLEQLEHMRVGDLQPQMQEMLGFEGAGQPCARRSTSIDRLR